jgi:hypothetical protein
MPSMPPSSHSVPEDLNPPYGASKSKPIEVLIVTVPGQRRQRSTRSVPSAHVDGIQVSAYADNMESALAITEAAAGSDPDTGLRAVAALRALTERLEILQVDNARTHGWSWQDIATRLGVTRQTVHRKHGKRTTSR